MYAALGTVTLRSGEVVEAGMIHGPDLEWAGRLEKLLWHKGDPWNWQNAQFLERALPIETFFYVLHRAGVPLANLMTAEYQGVGHFGHVFTLPADRQQGASSQLMRLQMADFQRRGGRALYLGTGYESVAYKMYASFGFASIEPASGYMAYYAESAERFGQACFAPLPPTAAPTIATLSWQDWVMSAPLLFGDYRGVIRCAPCGLIGRQSPEGPFLEALLDEERQAAHGAAPKTVVLRHPTTAAVVGLAAWNWDNLWPDTCLVDVYCHPDYWDYGNQLLDALVLPSADRIIAYVDTSDRAKVDLLMARNFHPIATLPNFVARDVTKSAMRDVTVMQRNGSSG